MANGSTYLRKQLANSDQKKWTLSVWVKRTDVGNSSTHKIFGSGGGTWEAEIAFNSNDKFSFYAWNGGSYAARIQSNAAYRDINCWYHVVMRWDTANATAGERMRAYINGEELTSLQTNTVPAQNTNSEFNANSQHEVGAGGSGNGIFSGLMSHMHFCDGQSYAPTEFGETDTTTGEWKIKTDVSVTYGTQGFFIFEDGTNLSGSTVQDQSGQSNDWTLQAGTLTKSEDNPSNVFATFNSLHNYYEGGTYAYGNNQITTGGSNKYTWNNSTLAMTTGKYYAEFKWISGGSDILFGITDKFTRSSTGELGNYDKQYAYRTNGTVRNNNGDLGGWSGSTWTTGDVVGVLLDMDNHKLYFSKNGVIQNSSTGISISTSPEDGCYYFSSCAYDDNSCVLQANFGNGVFGNTALTGTTYNGADGNGIFKYDPNSITLDSTSKSFKSLSTKGLNA